MHHFAPEMQAATTGFARHQSPRHSSGHGPVGSHHHFSTASPAWDPSGNAPAEAIPAGSTSLPNAMNSVSKKGCQTMSRYALNLSSASSSVVVTAILTLAAVFAVVSTPAVGGLIEQSAMSNLNSPASTEFGSLAVGRTNVALAQGFKTGSDDRFLGLKKILLDLSSDQLVTTNSPVVQLWSSIGSGTSTLPSVQLASFAVQPPLPSGIPFGSAPAIYTFAGYFGLDPNTNYWVVVRDANPTVGKFRWDYNANGDSPVAMNNSGFTYIAAARSINDGSSWSQNNPATALSIELVAVPEPPTIILAGLGAAAVVGHGLRRRKLRQRDADGSDAEWTAEEGAIALTA
jgi:hypothetical protein